MSTTGDQGGPWNREQSQPWGTNPQQPSHPTPPPQGGPYGYGRGAHTSPTVGSPPPPDDPTRFNPTGEQDTRFNPSGQQQAPWHATSPAPYETGGGQQTPPPKRPWPLIAVALGCITALVLVIGGGITYLMLNRSGPEPTAEDTTTTEPSTTEPPSTDPESPSASETPTDGPTFEAISPIDKPEGTGDDMVTIMSNSPMTTGTIPAVRECEVPSTPVEHTPEQLQAMLSALGGCLSQAWSRAASDRGLSWSAPRITVFTWPDIPADAACKAETFDEGQARMCNLDNVLYWPVGYGKTGDPQTPDEVPGAYLFNLSVQYLNAVTWQMSLYVYADNAEKKYEAEGDEEGRRLAAHRWAMQLYCLTGVSIGQMPDTVQPSEGILQRITDPQNWSTGEPPYDFKPEQRVSWLEKGLESGGELGQCNAWAAPESTVV